MPNPQRKRPDPIPERIPIQEPPAHPPPKDLPLTTPPPIGDPPPKERQVVAES